MSENQGTDRSKVATFLAGGVLVFSVGVVGSFVGYNLAHEEAEAPTETTTVPEQSQESDPEPEADPKERLEETAPENSSTPQTEAMENLYPYVEGTEIPLWVINVEYLDTTCDLIYNEGHTYDSTAVVLQDDLYINEGIYEPDYSVYVDLVIATDYEWCRGVRGH